jgi:PrtD family type I secretion system ABC transporter
MRQSKEKTAPNPLAEIAPQLRRATITIGVVSAMLNILLLAGSIYMILVYDLVIPGRSQPTLFGLLAIVGAAYFFQGVLDLVRGQILGHVGFAIDNELEARIHQIVLMIARLMPGRDATQPSRDLEQLRGFISSSGPTALLDLPWVLFFVAVLFLLHPWLGVTVLVGATVLVTLTVLNDRMTGPAMERIVKLASTRQRALDASQRHSEAAFAMGMEHRMEALWTGANRRYLAAQANLAKSSGTLGTISRIFRLFLQSLVLTVGAILVIRGEASGGVIFASSILASRALAPVEQVIANWRGFVGARQAWDRLKQFMAQLDRPPPTLDLPPPRSILAIEALTLRPPGAAAPTVHDISFIAYAGEAIAVLGPSGCGKSTFLRGLLGILEPVSGSVRLDRATLDQWPRDVIGRHIGYLPQNVELISGTIAQNIARFEPDAPAEAIIEAARQAGVHDLIQHLPDGYNCDVGIDGRKLSAGQRQRIALARALYRDPFLLLLDEPNSNLDQDGERALVEAVNAAKARQAIVIVVAHRPSILEAIDLVLLMRNGRAQAYDRKERLVPHLLESGKSLPSQGTVPA